MFDSATFDALESAPRSRRWTTAFSFLLQVLAVSILLLIPLLYTDALPAIHYTEQLTVPAGPPQPKVIQIVASKPAHAEAQPPLVNPQLLYPGTMPDHAKKYFDKVNNSSGDTPTGLFVPGGTGNDSNGNVQRLIAINVPPPPIKADLHREPIRISNLSEGALLRRVAPIYPTPARNARIQGPVVMAALIDTEGRIANLRIVSGNPFLVEAAMNAVKQWRYRPYILNSQPIEVETQITVVFSLN